VPERLALAHARAQTLAIDKAGALRDPEQWLAAARLADDLDARVADRWTDAIDALDLEALAPRFRAWAGRFGLWRWFALRGPRRQVRQVRIGLLPDDATVAADLEAAIERRRVRRALDQARPLAARWLGALAPGEGPADLAAIDQALAWAGELRAAFDAIAIGGAAPADRVGREAAWKALVGQVVVAVPPSDDELLARSAEAHVAWRAAVARLGEVAGVALAALDGDGPILAAVADAAIGWRARGGELRDWTAYVRARRLATAAGVGPACAACEAGAVAPPALDQAWERAVLLRWAEAEVAARPVLLGFSGATHHARVAEHAELDRGALAVSRARIITRLVERVPRVDADPSGEIAVLLRERKKQRGHRPLRRLFKDIPALLGRLAPCLLMSPLSVAQYLDPALPRFDLVIFDEASQIPTADAIGALARGQAAVIVGDSRQLPPTRFFAPGQAASELADDDADDAPLESVLDECVAQRLPELSLGWHYRSKHEDLIAFSNARYYGDQLRVFPAAAARTPELGVEHRAAGGVYDRAGTRTNRIEAEAVVAEIVRRLGDPELRDRSIGVVTFSRPQQALIEDLLDDARAAEPAIEKYFGEAGDDGADAVTEPVIVKNLETIQGDERDVVLFSIGYGPDAAGDLAMQFGPLGQAGGERRLNVATTRARQKLIVFSSLAPADLARMTEDGRAIGVRHLGELIGYAQAGGGAGRPADDGAAASPVTAALAAGLTERGWIVRHQIGCAGYRIDLAIVDPDDPGRYVLGLETDGAAYASAPVARDRDRLRGLILGELGWRLHRLWSLDWWADPERELQRAHNAVIAAIAATRAARKSGGILRPALASGSGRAGRGATQPPGANELAQPPRPRTTSAPPIAARARTVSGAPEGGPAVAAPVAVGAPVAVAAAVARARTTGAPPASDRARGRGTDAPPGSHGPRVAAYVAASVPAGRRTADDLFLPKFTDEVGKLIAAVLATEAPIHVELLARRVGAYFGIGRVTPRVTERLRELLGERGRFGAGDDADVVWRADQDATALPMVRVAGEAAATRRDIDEVPVAELAAAAAVVLHRAAGAPIDELVRDTAHLLGFARVSERIAKRVRSGIDVLAGRGGCVIDGARAALP
jgi:hypothetical protein